MIDRKNIHKTLCSNIKFNNENVAVMLLSGDGGKLLRVFNPVSRESVWEEPIEDQFVDNPIIINNIVFLTSSRQKKEQSGEPTGIKKGKLLKPK